MRLGWAAVAAAAGIVAAATAVARAEAPRRPITDVVVPGDRPLQPGPPLEPRHRILFLNRNGGAYMPGNYDDSSRNISSIPSRAAYIPPFSGSDTGWNAIVACVKSLYAPFAIEVTDVEPPPEVAYIESVVGGNDTDLGVAAGGIAPGYMGCGPTERGINFTFSAQF